jgi:hypothetical protein
MHWWQFVLQGAAGGSLAEVLSLFKHVAAWQAARRAPSGRLRARRAAFTKYVDVPAHIWMLVLRAMVGAASAGVFAAGDQLKGAFAGVALGFCGPMMLVRLGQNSLVDSFVQGGKPAAGTESIALPMPEQGAAKGLSEVIGEH